MNQKIDGTQKIDFGKRFAYQMAILGLTREEVAFRLGMKSATIRSWEKGVSLPNPIMIMSFPDKLGLDISHLMGITKDPKRINIERLIEKSKEGVRINKEVLNELKEINRKLSTD